MKIGFFITARLKSTRLKNKILLDLNGKSVLDRVIERAKKVQGVDGVVLCTSTDPQDSILYKNALANKIEFYAGHPDDVLKRLLDAALYYQYDAFVSITADNPFFSIYTSELSVNFYKQQKFDFINTTGLPVGCATYMLDVKALQIVDFIKNQTDTEIWGPFINRPDFFNVVELKITNSPINCETRITLDYPEDYLLIRKIYNKFNRNAIPSIFNLFDIISSDKGLLEINKMHKQIYLDPVKIKRITNEFEANTEKALEFAFKIDKKLKPGKTIIKVSL